MSICCISGKELSPELRAAWREIQTHDSEVQNPFLAPEFAQAVSAVRDSVQVAVIENGGRPVGFLPFERRSRHLAVPCGAGMSEFQAVVAEAQAEWEPRQLLKGCGLKRWQFDHLLATQQAFQPGHAEVGASPYMDLAAGYKEYEVAQRRASSCITTTARKQRKLQREMGPLRFELYSDQRAVFDAVVRWKSEQVRRSGLLDIFRFDWVVELLERVWQTHSSNFRGVLSALYSDETLIAVHLGLRSSSVAHVWFPAFDPQFSAYSPGMILLLEMARELSEDGVRRIDFGPGAQRYKQQLRSGDVMVAQGVVDQSKLRSSLRRRYLRVKDHVRSSPLRRPARIPAYALFRLRQWLAFR